MRAGLKEPGEQSVRICPVCARQRGEILPAARVPVFPLILKTSFRSLIATSFVAADYGVRGRPTRPDYRQSSPGRRKRIFPASVSIDGS